MIEQRDDLDDDQITYEEDNMTKDIDEDILSHPNVLLQINSR